MLIVPRDRRPMYEDARTPLTERLAVCNEAQARAAARSIIDGGFGLLDLETLRCLADTVEVEIINRMAAESGYTQEE